MAQTTSNPSEALCLDVSNACLWRGTQRVPLTPTTLALLQYLRAHAGQLVTIPELLSAVWPATSVSVDAVHASIRRLRRLLGDAAQAPRFIETVPRQGYRLIGTIPTTTAPGPHPTARSCRATPLPAWLIGREAMLTQLQGWYARVLQRERRVGFITGEVGIGKTTLVEALLDALAAQAEILILHGQCLEHYGVGEAYLPLFAALQQGARGPQGIRVVTALRRYAPTWLLHMPGLLPTTAYETLQRQHAGATRERMLRELAEALEALAAEHPLVLVLEDLHWSDAATLDLVTLLVQRHEPARFLLLGTWRPEDVLARHHPLRMASTTWRRRPHVQEVVLPPLTAEDIAAYLAARYPGECMPAAVVEVLHRRTEGNPLLLVMVLEHLVTQGILRQQDGIWRLPEDWPRRLGEVPTTARDVIRQRQALCSPDEQQVLAVASVAGMTFSAATVAAGLQADLLQTEAWCEGLAQRGLFLQVQGEDTWPDGTVATLYGFRHALYQQVLYEQLPAARRGLLHRRIGLREETGYGARAREHAARLALRFERGHDTPRAVAYHGDAATNALQRSAYAEALSHITRGCEFLSALPDTPAQARHALTLHLMRGAALSATQGYAALEVEQAYTQARDLSAQLGDTAQMFTALAGLWRVALVRGQLQTARALGEHCLTLAHQARDAALLAEAHYALGTTLCYLGDLRAAYEQAERGIARYDPRHHRALAVRYGGTDPGVACRSYAAQVLWLLGYPDRAVQRNSEALTLAQELGHALSLVYALNQTLVLHQFRREGRAAQECAEEVSAVCREQGFPQMLAMATILRGWAVAEQGRLHEGITWMRHGLSVNPSGTGLGRPPVLALLAEAYGAIGQTEAGIACLTEALALVHTTEERWCEAELYRLKGELLLRPPCTDVQQGERCFRQALAVAHRQQAKAWELRAAMSLSRLWQQQGKRREAYDLLAPIDGWFTEGFDTADLQEAKTLLEALTG